MDRLDTSAVRVVMIAAGCPWEADVVDLLHACGDVDLVRRAGSVVDARVSLQVDAPDVMVIDSEFPGLRADLLAECRSHGVAVVLVGDGTGPADRFSGLDEVVQVPGQQVDAERLLAAVRSTVADSTSASGRPARPEPGRVVAVWGAVGSPGRSALSLVLAGQWAAAGRSVALVDADVAAPSLAPWLGAGDGPGLLAACLAVARGGPDAGLPPRTLFRIGPGLDLLPGPPHPQPRSTVGQRALTDLVAVLRGRYDAVVIDAGAGPLIEHDEVAVCDCGSVTSAALGVADLAVAVVAVDPLGISRFRASLPALLSLLPGGLSVVGNRVRSGMRRPEFLADDVSELAAPAQVLWLPDMPTVFDRSLWDGGLPVGGTAGEAKALGWVAERVADSAGLGRRAGRRANVGPP